MIVIDASAIVELLLGGPKVRALAPRIASEDLHAPDLIDIEVLSALRRHESTGVTTAVAATVAVHTLTRLALTRHSCAPFALRIWQLRANLSTYDACYVTLAESIAAPLVTCDARIARAPGHRARVEVF